MQNDDTRATLGTCSPAAGTNRIYSSGSCSLRSRLQANRGGAANPFGRQRWRQNANGALCNVRYASTPTQSLGLNNEFSATSMRARKFIRVTPSDDWKMIEQLEGRTALGGAKWGALNTTRAGTKQAQARESAFTTSGERVAAGLMRLVGGGRLIEHHRRRRRGLQIDGPGRASTQNLHDSPAARPRRNRPLNHMITSNGEMMARSIQSRRAPASRQASPSTIVVRGTGRPPKRRSLASPFSHGSTAVCCHWPAGFS
jgi:hypothetical protein